MIDKAKESSSLASGKRDGSALDQRRLAGIYSAIQAAEHPMDAMSLAQLLTDQEAEEAPQPTRPASSRVKKYDHRSDYEEGERVYVDNRYGKSFATITKIIRQPASAFCDKAFLEFDDTGYRTKWEHERSTPYFAINSGRLNTAPVYVDAEDNAAPRRPRFNATAMAKLARAVDRALEANAAYALTTSGWTPAERATAPVKPHISAEPGGAPESSTVSALSQGVYKAPLLEVLDQMGEATIEDIKRNVQSSIKLGPADWETDATGKIVWIHRLHAAIKHLKRVGTIDSPRREVYRRSKLHTRTA